MRMTWKFTLPVWAWIMVAGFGLLLVFAVILDLRQRLRIASPVVLASTPAEEVVEALRFLGQERAEGGRLFTVASPPGWLRVSGPDAHPYDLMLHNQRGVSIGLMATPVAYDDLHRLGTDIRRQELSRDMLTAQELIRLEGRPFIQRKLRLVTQQVLALDCLEKRVAYHILCAAPREVYDVYEPLFLAVAGTLRSVDPVTPAAAPAESGAAGTPGSG